MVKKKIFLGLLFTVAIVFFGYTAYNLVFGPYYFSVVKEQRYSEIKAKMKNIAEAQEYFLSVTGKYADSFDTLTTVLKNDSFLTERNLGVESDSVKYISRTKAMDIFDLSSSLTEDEVTDKLGEILLDREERYQNGEKLEIYIVKDSIYEPIINLISFNPDDLYAIPYSNDTFDMSVSSKRTAGGGVTVNLFQVLAYNKQFLTDQKRAYFKGDEGIQCGSLEEASKDIKEIIIYDTE